MNEYRLDPLVWYSTRELEQVPKHFIIAKSNLTAESRLWILNNLKGRFAIIQVDNDTSSAGNGIISIYQSDFLTPAFEDPKEAVLYELTWS